MKISSVRHLRRHASLALLVTEAGGTTALATRAATPKSHISAMQAGRRGVGDALAARFERLMGKPPGWMDTEHAQGQAATALTQEEIDFVTAYRETKAKHTDTAETPSNVSDLPGRQQGGNRLLKTAAQKQKKRKQ